MGTSLNGVDLDDMLSSDVTLIYYNIYLIILHIPDIVALIISL